MHNFKLTLVTLFFSFSILFSQNNIKIKKGNWNSHLQLSESILLPVRLEIIQKQKKYDFIIHNAEEKITLINIENKLNDSLKLEFPNFNSYLMLKINSSKNISGYWYNLNKSKSYKIPFFASYNSVEKKCSYNDTIPISGKWKTIFDSNNKNQERAIGIFKNIKNNIIHGTFLTESGDYRFLEGKNCKSSFYLSCFDGSHAFLFTGQINNNDIKGMFYSGIHYKTDWNASKNYNFELKNPDSITFVQNKENIHFELKDLNGKSYIFPNEETKNKVIIIQIIGTWCPNCIDESRYFKELYEKYNKDGLKIISVAYEASDKFEEQVKTVSRLKEKLNLSFTFLIGGQANKNLASKHFSMLNSVSSYPTSIIINREGEVVKIHTGFNGPGTGTVYEEFKKEFEEFIINQLKK